MRRVFLTGSSLLLLSFYCFAQQNLPRTIYGKIPDSSSTKIYQIQVGAFKLEKNAESAALLLRKNALSPVIERHLDFSRVLIKGIPADQVFNFLVVIKQAGFNEVIIREDTAAPVTAPAPANTHIPITAPAPLSAPLPVSAPAPANSQVPTPAPASAPAQIPAPANTPVLASTPTPAGMPVQADTPGPVSTPAQTSAPALAGTPAPASIQAPARTTLSEKWEISSPDSDYSSFEFSHDNHYIAVENDGEKSVHFGAYTMPQEDTINLDKLGTVTINSNDVTGLDFTFTPAEEPEKAASYSAVVAETIPASPELDLFCRTWKVISCTESDRVGILMLISKSGTYFSTSPDGETSSLSEWRWYNENKESFEYSHDNWEHYGRAEILDLKADYLSIYDPGYSYLTPGYSVGYLDNYWEFIPANQGD